jgi:multidrug transporter EmrE-like cation transporter
MLQLRNYILLTFLMSCGAAIGFAIGGIFMKLSLGLSQPLYTMTIFVFFGLGIVLQTLAIERTDLGSSYILVLGLEAIASAIFSTWLFKENFSPTNLIGLAAIAMGVILLRTKELVN